MRAVSYWNDRRDLCVIAFERPIDRIGEMPNHAVNYALKVFYDQDAVCDPFLYTVWDTPATQWGLVVAESMDLTDQQLFELARAVLNTGGEPPYDTKEWRF